MPENYGFLIDYLLPRSFKLIDYLDKDGLLLFDDWQSIKKNVADVDAQNEAFISEEIKAGAMLNSQKLRHRFQRVVQKSKQDKMLFALFQQGMGRLKFDEILNFATREVQHICSQMHVFKSDLTGFVIE